MKSTYFVILFSLYLCGCEDKPTKITNVTRVFMQNEGKYILYTQQSGSSDVQTMTIDAGQGNKIRVVTDVPEGQAAWFEGTFRTGVDLTFGTLHVHDLRQIEGAEDERRVGRGRMIRNQNAPVE